MIMKKRYLVLGCGEVFEGEAFGADCETVGELVFTTGMCGYIETLTDPSYYGQIVMQTFPLIGNYGMIREDCEVECALRGYVVREHCENPSNFRSEGTLDSFLREKGIPGICGIDTRRVTEIIRETGVMNAAICSAPEVALDRINGYTIENAVASVSCREPYTLPAVGEQRFRVALIDYGAKRNIARELCRRGCALTVYPHTVGAAEILGGGYDGVMLSNGPGDPSENVYEISVIAEMFGRLPIFGICLGHQLLALSQGGQTVKLKYGHRGGNQPVREVGGARTYITSQNHGYAVLSDTVSGGRESYVNANDGSCEGMDYPRAFSVQFHPEACSGPRDAGFLFDRFISLMEDDR